MRWLPGAKLNIAESAVCNRSPDAIAIVWADESSPSQLATVSWGQLKHRCQHVAAALVAAGFEPGMPEDLAISRVTFSCDTIATHCDTIFTICLCSSTVWLTLSCNMHEILAAYGRGSMTS